MWFAAVDNVGCVEVVITQMRISSAGSIRQSCPTCAVPSTDLLAVHKFIDDVDECTWTHWVSGICMGSQAVASPLSPHQASLKEQVFHTDSFRCSRGHQLE